MTSRSNELHDDPEARRINDLLDAEEQRLCRAVAELRVIALDEGFDEHDAGQPAWTSEDAADAASDTLTKEVGHGLIADFGHALDDVRDARLRLLHHHYGLCERCGAAVDPMRLDVVPATRWCMACALEAEADVRCGLVGEPGEPSARRRH